jgi:hypothetical protein
MKYDKYDYKKMSELDYDKSIIVLAKEIGCSRQHFYKLKTKFDEEKRILDMELQLKECRAKLKALEA